MSPNFRNAFTWQTSLCNAFCRKEKKRNKPKHDAQNLDVVQHVRKINKKRLKLGGIYQKATKLNICKVGP
jgi:hypothetical protein